MVSFDRVREAAATVSKISINLPPDSVPFNPAALLVMQDYVDQLQEAGYVLVQIHRLRLESLHLRDKMINVQASLMLETAVQPEFEAAHRLSQALSLSRRQDEVLTGELDRLCATFMAELLRIDVRRIREISESLAVVAQQC